MDPRSEPWYPQRQQSEHVEELWLPSTPAEPDPGPRHVGRSGEHRRSCPPASGHARLNEDLDLDELDPQGRSRHRAAQRAAQAAERHPRRKRAFQATAVIGAGAILAVAALGTYAYEHLFGQVDTESLDSLTDRPAAARADRWGNVPENILLLGSQTRDGQRGPHLGNSSKLGTDISDTAMLVHINAEKKWATVVSIPRDLIVPRPKCRGRLDPTQTVPAASDAMFDLAMNLGGPTCAVATVEQMTGIRVDHFVEITFNAFQALTNAVGGVTVCVPPPGINDPNYSGLVLSPGLHTVSGPESLAFVRDRHGLANGTDLNRIRMQQMFVTSLFNKLASAGTLGDPITLYKIADAVTSNLTVDTGLDSIDAMVGLAGGVQSLKSHYIQFITVPYGFDPGNQNRVIPGPGFDEVWTALRNDTPLPGSNAAQAFGTTPSTRSSTPPPGADATATAGGTAGPAGAAGVGAGAGADAGAGAGAGTGAGAGAGTEAGADSVPATLANVPINVYNSTVVPHLAAYATTNLKAMGLDAQVGTTSKRYSGYAQTEILYPSGDLAQAQALQSKIVGSVTLQQSRYAQNLTLVIGQNRPAGLVAAPAGAAGATDPNNAQSPTDPTASISAESRTGDENICSDLPDTVKFGGHP